MTKFATLNVLYIFDEATIKTVTEMKHLLITIHNGYCMQVLKEICLAVATINGKELSISSTKFTRLNEAFGKVAELVHNHNENIEKDHRELVLDTETTGVITIKNKHLIQGEPDHPILMIRVENEIVIETEPEELKQIGGENVVATAFIAGPSLPL